MKESHKRLKEVYDKGYRVNSEGEVISPKTDKARKISLHGDKRWGLYYKFTMKFNKQSYPIAVHRLVAYQKYGDKMFDAETVRHLDGDSTNNNFDNIVIGSYSDNAYDRDEVARKEHAVKAASASRKFSDDEIRYIRSSDIMQKELCEKYSVSKNTIYNIRKRKSYQDVLDKA